MDAIFTGMTTPVALALVALLGYLVGWRARQVRQTAQRPPVAESDPDWNEARQLAEQMELISNDLRRRMASHHFVVGRFRDQIRVLSQSHAGDEEPVPHARFTEMLAPADQLSHDIATAYDELRQHASSLARLRSRRSRTRS